MARPKLPFHVSAAQRAELNRLVRAPSTPQKIVRRARIALLAAAGWGVVEGSRIRREFSITPGRIEGGGRRGKPLIADYVLVYRNRKLAVVEAKALDEAVTEGVAQAKNYAGKLAVRYAYSTNGQGIYQIDMSHSSHSSH
jgi:type I site-specific restriction endonuclease